MSQMHYDGCGCTADADYQELDPDGEYCDSCLLDMDDDELPARLKDVMK